MMVDALPPHLIMVQRQIEADVLNDDRCSPSSYHNCSGGDGSRCSTTIGGCCFSGDHHYHLSAGIFIIFTLFNIDIYRWRVLTKKKPLPGFSLMISVWMSQQKLVHCVVCNCTSINLSSCKKDLAVQRGGKISRGYFHFLNGTFNFQLIFKMFYLSKKNFRPKRFSVIFKLKWTMLLSTWPS